MTIARVRNLVFWVLAACLGLFPAPAAAQPSGGTSIDSLRWDINRLEREVDLLNDEVRSLRDDVGELRDQGAEAAAIPVALLLFFTGVFCALWAQSTGRSGFVWFFLGVFFHLFTLLAVLVFNARRPAWSGPQASG
jgi:hypothetical protein